MIPLARRVEPEWLDSLPHDDPRARRGRRDLRLVNFAMGNERWILRTVAAHREHAAEGIVELGAGSGALTARLGKIGPTLGCDLAPRPPALPDAVRWAEGDLFAPERGLAGGILVANLFLHHFEGEALRRLGEIAQRFRLLVFVEPLRSCGALVLSGALLPFVGDVTRHDMPISIRAGFVPGDLPRFLGLPSGWSVTEKATMRGALRTVAHLGK